MKPVFEPPTKLPTAREELVELRSAIDAEIQREHTGHYNAQRKTDGLVGVDRDQAMTRRVASLQRARTKAQDKINALNPSIVVEGGVARDRGKVVTIDTKGVNGTPQAKMPSVSFRCARKPSERNTWPAEGFEPITKGARLPEGLFALAKTPDIGEYIVCAGEAPQGIDLSAAVDIYIDPDFDWLRPLCDVLQFCAGRVVGWRTQNKHGRSYTDPASEVWVDQVVGCEAIEGRYFCLPPVGARLRFSPRGDCLIAGEGVGARISCALEIEGGA